MEIFAKAKAKLTAAFRGVVSTSFTWKRHEQKMDFLAVACTRFHPVWNRVCYVSADAQRFQLPGRFRVADDRPSLFQHWPALFFAFGLLVFILKFARMTFRWLFSWLGFKGSLLALAVLTILIALFYAEEDWRGWRAWQICRGDLAAQGESLVFADFIPPPVPDDQNFALTPVVASCYGRFLDCNGRRVEPPDTNIVNRLAMTVYRDDYNGTTNQRPNSWQIGGFTDLKAWQEYYRTISLTNSYLTCAAEGHGYVTNLEIQSLAPSPFPVAPAPQSPAAAVLLALSRFDPAIEALRQASRLSHSRFPLDYGTRQVYEILTPHLQSIRGCAQVLSLRAVTELANGQTEKAFADEELIFYLANSIRNEPTSLSQVVHDSIFNLALQPLWEGQAKHQWNDAQLTALDADLSRSDFLSCYQMKVRIGRATAIGFIEAMGQKQKLREFCRGTWSDAKEGSLGWRELAQAAFFYLMPHGWFDLNKCFVARIFQQSLLTDQEIRRQIIPPSAVQHSTGIIMDEFKARSFYEVFVPAVFPPLFLDVERMTREQASTDLARTAGALERYYHAHGEYPGSLDALKPQFIETIPHDIINGQPLHYVRMDNGRFLLYSVGWNGTDDGGRVVLTKGDSVDREKGDWVWQYPAK